MGVHDLGRFELLRDVDPATLERIESTGTEVRLSSGAVLVEQGQLPTEVHLVLEGEVTIETDGQAVGALGPGDLVGEMAALDGAPRAATVRADGPVRTLAFSSEAFDSLLTEVPELRRKLTTALTRKLRHATAGWANLAGSTDLLLSAFLALQESADPSERAAAVEKAAALLEQTARAEDGPKPDSGALAQLTKAERRVADLVAEGLSNQAIADQLYVSRHTVESHLKHIFTKLGLKSRVALATLVLRES